MCAAASNPTDSLVPLQLRLLGTFELVREGQHVSLPAPAERLLAFLALQRRPLVRAYVAGTLWLNSSEDRALGSLRSALWFVRHADPALVAVAGQSLCLSRGVDVDVDAG